MPPVLALASPWTVAEDAVLRARYDSEPAELIAASMDRTLSAVFHRARRLGLKRRRRWTAEDDRCLVALWGAESLPTIARRLGRTRAAVYVRAREIHLECGASTGYEYLTGAAKRTGYTVEQLRVILKAGGVRISRSMSRPSNATRSFHVVDPYDVDRAVEAWHATELVHPAAVARGIGGDVLRGWLLAAIAEGTEMPKPPKRFKARWRVPSSVIDAVIARRNELESVARAALRVGVSRQTLTLWLIDAGVPRFAVKPWLVEQQAVDRLVAEHRAAPRRRARRAA